MGKLSEVLLRRPVAEGLMRAHGVVDLLPGVELAVERPDGPGEVPDLVELLGVGALGTQTGPSGRSTESLSLGERGGSTKSLIPRS